MTNTDLAARTTIIPPGEPDLATLAKEINAGHDAVKAAMLSGAQRAIAVGKLLLKAKALVRHGQWEDWVATNTNLSDRVAVRYMALANGENLLVAKAPNLADLTMTEAIKVLEELKAPEQRQRLGTGGQQRGGRRDPVATAIKKAPTAILERAWGECTSQEQQIFLPSKMPST
jgi:hypothetical protein